jgi:hypothetical protein
MISNKRVLTAVVGATVVLAASGVANAADLPTKAPAPVAEVPFFFVNDNRLTYAYEPNGAEPGYANKTAVQTVALTHFDVWAYGTNFANVLYVKEDHAAPAAPCNFSNQGCAGAAYFYGLVRSTFGFNQIFNTKAFTVGPLQNISFEVGADAETENNTFASNKRILVAGLQFSFALPYKGYFNVSPLVLKDWSHSAFVTDPAVNPTGDLNYHATWAVETNYYMDLGFLPESIRYFSISGRAGWIGPRGTGTPPALTANLPTKVEFNSEPIRLTFDASKALWGEKYSHFAEVWVAYKYWQNKFGADHDNLPACTGVGGPGVARSCTESSVYSGVTLKF